MTKIEDKSFVIKFKIKDIIKDWWQGSNYYRAKVYYEINDRDIHMFNVSTDADNIGELKSLVNQHIRKNLIKINKLL